jgi:hypothetical protein
MNRRADVRVFVLVLLLWGVFALIAEQNKPLPRGKISSEIRIALPLFVQVLGFAGDRYLAANVAGIRALVVETGKMTGDEFVILGKVQSDVSLLNPAHEDNYYTAAAILPWNGELDAAQTILARATGARPYDYQPAFYYAFNRLHFYKDAKGASEWLLMAADKLPEGDERLQMQNLAAIWMDKVSDTNLAIRVVSGMAEQSKRKDFRRYLEQRVARLKSLRDLRDAQKAYQHKVGQPLRQLEDLVTSGIIDKIPEDVFGFGFAIDASGQIVLRVDAPRKP